jgi:hypothetical protein
MASRTLHGFTGTTAAPSAFGTAAFVAMTDEQCDRAPADCWKIIVNDSDPVLKREGLYIIEYIRWGRYRGIPGFERKKDNHFKALVESGFDRWSRKIYNPDMTEKVDGIQIWADVDDVAVEKALSKVVVAIKEASEKGLINGAKEELKLRSSSRERSSSSKQLSDLADDVREGSAKASSGKSRVKRGNEEEEEEEEEDPAAKARIAAAAKAKANAARAEIAKAASRKANASASASASSSQASKSSANLARRLKEASSSKKAASAKSNKPKEGSEERSETSKELSAALRRTLNEVKSSKSSSKSSSKKNAPSGGTRRMKRNRKHRSTRKH